MNGMKYMVNDLAKINALTFDSDVTAKFNGLLEKSIRFIERNQIYDVNLWRKFVEQFRLCDDDENGGWRGEYWGKMMRGACMVVQYTGDDGFYRILEASVRDILTTQDEDGRISSYSKKAEFGGWDLWGRKYVMLGMLYFSEICKDESLAQAIRTSLCRQADYIIAHIGKDKLDIRAAAAAWLGLPASSILEPMVKLYKLTGEQTYLDFAEYIISEGFCFDGNLIELAYENKLSPHEYPVVKAYEMMSCFEGLLHYYRLTGKEKHKTAIIHLGNRIIDDELSIIGCSGCTHELFDHTAIKQTQTDYDYVVQETCVTVTWLRFAQGILELTGDVKFADAIEQSFYNAYLGALNTQRVPYSNYPQAKDVPQVMPFDSYSPLTASSRGRVTGGYQTFSDGSFYGCCACIGSAGAGIMPRYAVLQSENGIVINFYESGTIATKTPQGRPLSFTVDTAYPIGENVNFTVSLKEAEQFDLSLRIPSWCKNATLEINGVKEKADCGYHTVKRTWQNGDTVILTLEMKVVRILPPKGAVNEDLFAGYKRGPMVLAADARLADPTSVLDILCDADGCAESQLVSCPEISDCNECVELKKANGEKVRLIDYASAGKTFSQASACAAWLYRKKQTEAIQPGKKPPIRVAFLFVTILLEKFVKLWYTILQREPIDDERA